MEIIVLSARSIDRVYASKRVAGQGIPASRVSLSGRCHRIGGDQKMRGRRRPPPEQRAWRRAISCCRRVPWWLTRSSPEALARSTGTPAAALRNSPPAARQSSAGPRPEREVAGLNGSTREPAVSHGDRCVPCQPVVASKALPSCANLNDLARQKWFHLEALW